MKMEVEKIGNISTRQWQKIHTHILKLIKKNLLICSF